MQDACWKTWTAEATKAQQVLARSRVLLENSKEETFWNLELDDLYEWQQAGYKKGVKVATTVTNSKNQKIVQRKRLSVMRDIVVCKLLQQSHIDAEDLLKFTELLCAISIDRDARSFIELRTG